MRIALFKYSVCTGLAQPDEDDYGYVSQEASAFYNKLMEKYTSTPSEEPKFSKKSLLKSSAADLNNTKVC
jgi:protein SPT2